MMKKIIAVLLALITIFSFSAIAFAADSVPMEPYISINMLNGKNKTENAQQYGYGGRYWICPKDGFVHAEVELDPAGTGYHNNSCVGCSEENFWKTHKVVTVYYGIKCPDCLAYNCAYNASDFECDYKTSQLYTAPDGTKMNECSVCGHLFKNEDLEKIIIDNEETGESHKEYKYFRVIDDPDNIIETVGGKYETDMTVADFQKKQSSKVLNYMIMPFIKIYRAVVSLPGRALNILYAILQIVAPEIVTKIIG